uniref:Uncharacterized protein n=1 Tax=Magallana gigas TaxID=29159 RepID=K1RB79_MAGGI|eukprot:XP_011420387.1 PREDICTED: uncharacterized protein LOC105323120 [Crassostrea gigas]
MLGRSILVSLLAICVSAQERSSSQLSRSSFLQDGGQSSWSSLPNSVDVRPHNERTIGTGSLLRNQGSLIQPLNVPDSTEFGSLNLFNRNSNSLFSSQGSMLQPADLGSRNLRNLDSRSLFRNQGSILDPGGIPVSPYSYEPYSLGSSASDGSRFMDITMRGQGMLNRNPRMNRNDMFSSRGLNLPNLQSSLLPRNQGLSGFSSDGSLSVLDGRSIGNDVSGFSRSMPWEMSRGSRTMNSFPFQFPDRRNLNVPSMPLSQPQGAPRRLLRATQSSQRGSGQLGLDRGLAGRIGNGLGLNRWNMQGDMSTGPRNVFRNLGLNRMNGIMDSNSRSGSNDRPMDEIWIFRNRGNAFSTGVLGNNGPLSSRIPQNDRRMDEIWISRNRGGSFSNGVLGNNEPIMDNIWASQNNLAGIPVTPNRLTQPSRTSSIGRTSSSLTSSLSRDLTSGPRTSRTTVYQPTSSSQIVGQRQGAGRIASF